MWTAFGLIYINGLQVSIYELLGFAAGRFGGMPDAPRGIFGPR